MLNKPKRIYNFPSKENIKNKFLIFFPGKNFFSKKHHIIYYFDEVSFNLSLNKIMKYEWKSGQKFIDWIVYIL